MSGDGDGSTWSSAEDAIGYAEDAVSGYAVDWYGDWGVGAGDGGIMD